MVYAQQRGALAVDCTALISPTLIRWGRSLEGPHENDTVHFCFLSWHRDSMTECSVTACEHDLSPEGPMVGRLDPSRKFSLGG